MNVYKSTTESTFYWYRLPGLGLPFTVISISTEVSLRKLAFPLQLGIIWRLLLV